MTIQDAERILKDSWKCPYGWITCQKCAVSELNMEGRNCYEVAEEADSFLLQNGYTMLNGRLITMQECRNTPADDEHIVYIYNPNLKGATYAERGKRASSGNVLRSY